MLMHVLRMMPGWNNDRISDQKTVQEIVLRTDCCTLSGSTIEMCCDPTVVWIASSSPSSIRVPEPLLWFWSSTSEFSRCCKTDDDGATTPEASSAGMLLDDSVISICARVCVRPSGLAMDVVA